MPRIPLSRLNITFMLHFATLIQLTSKLFCVTNELMLQRGILSHEHSILEEAVLECLLKTMPKSMGIADLGCGSGPNSSMVIFQIINTVCSKVGSSALPELRVSLNDLPQNDFNYLHATLPEFYDKLRGEKGIGPERCFVSVVAGSFYGRLFPNKSLHFVHSSSSLHWLSQVGS